MNLERSISFVNLERKESLKIHIQTRCSVHSYWLISLQQVICAQVRAQHSFLYILKHVHLKNFMNSWILWLAVCFCKICCTLVWLHLTLIYLHREQRHNGTDILPRSWWRHSRHPPYVPHLEEDNNTTDGLNQWKDEGNWLWLLISHCLLSINQQCQIFDVWTLNQTFFSQT